MTALKPLVAEYGLSIDGTLVLDRERNLAVENASIKNLNVTGTLTSINTTDSLIKDNNILLNSGIEPGAVDTLGSITVGSNYTQGLYRNIPLIVTSGTVGTGATADITVAIDGTVDNVNKVDGGSGYDTDTVFGVAAADIDSNTDGSGFVIPVTAVLAGSTATDASITVARGSTGDDVAIQWDESESTWTLTRDGSAYSVIQTALDISTAATANKLVLRDGNGDITVSDINAVDGTFSGDVAVNGGDLTTTATATFNLLTSSINTANVFTSATTVNIGSTTSVVNVIDDIDVAGDAQVDGALTVTGNVGAADGTFSGDVGAVNATLSGDLGAVNATLSGDLGAVDGTFSGDVAVNGGDLTTTASSATLFNSATTLNIANTGTDARTISLATAASGGASTLTFGGAVSGNILKIQGTATGEVSLTTDVITGNANLFTSVSGKLQIGTEDTRIYIGDKAAIVSHETDIATNQSGNAHVTDTFKTNEFRSAEYLIHVEAGTEYQVSKILLTHKGTNPVNGATEVNNVYITEYGTITSNAILATVDADLNGDTINQVSRLLITPSTNAATTVRVVRTSIVV